MSRYFYLFGGFAILGVVASLAYVKLHKQPLIVPTLSVSMSAGASNPKEYLVEDPQVTSGDTYSASGDVSLVALRPPTTTATIKSFTVKQNSSETSLPVVVAELSWNVVDADSVSIDFQCPEGVKITLFTDNSGNNQCGKSLVLFNDSHNATEKVVVMDTVIASNSTNRNLVVDVVVRAQNFKPTLLTTARQGEIFLGKRLTTNLNGYPNLSDINGAEAALKDYFDLINVGAFKQVLQYITTDDVYGNFFNYINNYSRSNGVDATGIIDILRNYLCGIGSSCSVTVSKIISSREKEKGVFEIIVEFVEKNGNQFSVHPVCYAEDVSLCRPPVTQFTYVVRKVGQGSFNIFRPITGPSLGQ